MKDELITILMVIATIILVGFVCFDIGYKVMQQDAVDQNLAHWTIDNKKCVKFEWINK